MIRLCLAVLVLSLAACTTNEEKAPERSQFQTAPTEPRCPPGSVPYGDVCRIVVDTGGA